MKYKIVEDKGKKFETVEMIATDFDESSDMENIIVGVYGNGRGFVTCRPKNGFPFSIPIPFMEQGEWQYVERVDETDAEA
jgi:hypothetical protein